MLLWTYRRMRCWRNFVPNNKACSIIPVKVALVRSFTDLSLKFFGWGWVGYGPCFPVPLNALHNCKESRYHQGQKTKHQKHHCWNDAYVPTTIPIPPEPLTQYWEHRTAQHVKVADVISQTHYKPQEWTTHYSVCLYAVHPCVVSVTEIY